MFEFLNKILKTKKPENNDSPSSEIKEEKAESAIPKEPVQKELKPQEPEQNDKPAGQSGADSGGPTYEEVRKRFPQLLKLMVDYLEKQIPGDNITDRSKSVIASAEVYGKYIDKIYLDINQASDGHMTLIISAGKRGWDIRISNYYFEAGRTKEEIFNFLRSPEMPDILDKAICNLDEAFRNRPD